MFFSINEREVVMMQTLLEMTKDLVAEQLRRGNLATEDVQSVLHSTHATLRRLHAAEQAGLAPAVRPPEAAPEAPGWRASIARHAIFCLECGESFKQLSLRHLRKHGLDPRSYRAKYGIPRTQPLSALTATARRRELARQIRPWEKAHEDRPRQAAAKKPGRQH